MGRNEEKHEGKINPLMGNGKISPSESCKSKVNTIERMAPIWSRGRPKVEMWPPQSGERAAPKWSKSHFEMDSGQIIFPHISLHLWEELNPPNKCKSYCIYENILNKLTIPIKVNIVPTLIKVIYKKDKYHYCKLTLMASIKRYYIIEILGFISFRFLCVNNRKIAANRAAFF